ncbi:MAG: hypothetical protein AC479_03495 [miscellaneous Crenarchaeota group-6 archaeon AD8-1]|nr:MAG: hypothetical protein AC479_03495 [miscellaneous Crenarchaeota group-6 archaeon AD8-1]
MILEELRKDVLIELLIDVVHSMIMYTAHKKYIRELALQGKLDFNPRELAIRLNMPLGEVLVILRELEESKKKI